MILSFKPQFKEPILKGTKIHTLRPDGPGRWKEGNHIHFATGVRTKNYECFKEGICVSVQDVEITRFVDGKIQNLVKVDDRTLSVTETQLLANNDGFMHLFEFWEWFSEDFKGKIIHWTDLRY